MRRRAHRFIRFDFTLFPGTLQRFILEHSVENTRPSDPPVRQSLQYAVRDGIFFSIMTGFGESYFGAFAIFLKASNPQIAMIAALPQLFGACFQLVSVRLLNLLKSRKTIILTGVVGQALTWLSILSLPFFFKQKAIPWLIGTIVAYFVLGAFANPAWNSLMGDLVDSNKRGRYFGRRNRLMSVATFSSLCAAGVILHQAEKYGRVAFGFALLFSIALVARFVSAFYLYRMAEPKYTHRAEDHFSLWQFIRDGRKTNFGRFVAYIAFIHFSVQISGPFIAPYLLRDLKFSYLEFMFASAATVLAQFLTLHFWGRFGDQFGNKKVLTLTGLLLPVIPVFWFFTTNFYWILAIQMFGGVCWAGFSLSMGNFVFDTVSPPKRAQCVAVYNLSNAVGIFLGASLGGFLSRWAPNEINIGAIHFSLVSNLQLLFLLSALLRLVVSLKFLPTIREVREVRPFIAKDLFIGIAQMRPISGLKFNLFTFVRVRNKRGAENQPAEPPLEIPVGVGDHEETGLLKREADPISFGKRR
ncbi:MAG TPA: MFS transporter [Candidatus Manganitrophaceae bacterium]|nr:MFS transporter [Candidatus Manganitrophaceae bacterium]